MRKGLRWTEQWMRRALWLVAFVFAGFLIGLGNQVVDNVIYLAPVPDAEHFLDPAKAGPLKAAMRAGAAGARGGRCGARTGAAEAPRRPGEHAERARGLRQLDRDPPRDGAARPGRGTDRAQPRARQARGAERTALAAVKCQEQVALDAKQAQQKATPRTRRCCSRPGNRPHGGRAARRSARSSCTAWRDPAAAAGRRRLFKHKRNGTYWPFTWGFIFFALFAFFVELVPYLPSYGGYVRYGVGILVTVLVGRYAIRWLHAGSRARRRSKRMPDAQRRTRCATTSRWPHRQGRVPVLRARHHYKDEHLAHCPHCGIGLFDRCPACNARKNAFVRYCFSCGTAANVSLAD